MMQKYIVIGRIFFSINVQAVCNYNLKISNIVVRWPGSSHDSTIFNISRLKAQFEAGIFKNSVIVGDSGYGVRPYLLTPLTSPTTEPEQLYNESQIRTRNPVERTYGVWKRRFPILALGIRSKEDNIDCIIVASAVLHNLAIDMKDNPPPNTREEEDAVDFVNNIPENIVAGAATDFQNLNINNRTRQELILNYFADL